MELTEEQRTLAGLVRRFTEERSSLAAARAAADGDRGPADELWTALGSELGLTGLLVPVEHGGLDGSVTDAALVAEALGHTLCPVPFLPSAVLATDLLVRAGSEHQRRRWLPELAAGTITAAVARTRDPVDGHGVTATAPSVAHAATASLFVVVGRSGPPRIVAADEPGIDVHGLVSVDPTRPLSRVTFRDVPAETLEAGGASAIDTAMAAAEVTLAAEAIGVGRACVELAATHARQRVQFNVPIGTFQAVKHPLADAHAKLSAARALVLSAAQAHDGELRDAALLTDCARACAVQRAADVAATCLQVLGGIGFTWEHDLHLYLRRALAARWLLGSPDAWRARLAARLGIGAADEPARAEPPSSARQPEQLFADDVALDL